MIFDGFCQGGGQAGIKLTPESLPMGSPPRYAVDMIVRGMPLTWLIVSVCVCRGSVCVFMHVRSST